MSVWNPCIKWLAQAYCCMQITPRCVYASCFSQQSSISEKGACMVHKHRELLLHNPFLNRCRFFETDFFFRYSLFSFSDADYPSSFFLTVGHLSQSLSTLRNSCLTSPSHKFPNRLWSLDDPVMLRDRLLNVLTCYKMILKLII